VRIGRYRGRHLIPRPNPVAGPAVATTAAAFLVAAPPASAATYRVQPGDTLSGIAAATGASMKSLARANDLSDPDRIYIGENLRIPGSSAPATVHVVTNGENLSQIASRYGVTLKALARANDIVDVNFIVTGEKLRIPGGGGGAVAQASAPAASSDPLPISDPDQVEHLLEHAAADEGIDAALVKAVAWQESGWQQSSVSSAGALGVMQVMPDTADYVNESLGGGNLDVRDTADNVKLGVKYLDHVVDSMPSERKGLAAYYTGPGNVGRTLSKIQKAYVNSVQALKERF
jgi:LysM repeat protein